MVRAQILLDCARFSPGEIDGVYGGDFGVAVKGYQESHGLKPSGVIDAEMWRLLNGDAGPVLLTYAITQADEGRSATTSRGPGKGEDEVVGFETPEEGLGESSLSRRSFWPS